MVLVLTPNGGEVVTVGQPVTILWKSASRVGLVAHQVQLSVDGGVTYNQDISPRLDGMARSYTWTPTADMVAKEARVRVVAIDRIGNWGVDDSDGTFIIQVGHRQSPAVKVLYPNGGERLGQRALGGERRVGEGQTENFRPSLLASSRPWSAWLSWRWHWFS